MMQHNGPRTPLVCAVRLVLQAGLQQSCNVVDICRYGKIRQSASTVWGQPPSAPDTPAWPHCTSWQLPMA